MRQNNEVLKIHFINVNHGDATIIEFPDYDSEHTARFAVVDFGAKKAQDRGLTRDYLAALIEHRRNNDPDFKFRIEFACVTHPHDDHFGGLKRFMQHNTPALRDSVQMFWDCGFRTNSVDYNDVLEEVISSSMTFVRVGAGSEFKFGDTHVSILAPSLDLRNRFDTYGVEKNDASIVLRIKYHNSYVILAGDAQYASWGKVTEEFPRTQGISFFNDALGLSERDDTADQLKCDLLRIAHHGSKHGTTLEYLERLKPSHVVIPAGTQQWYQIQISNWVGMFPHDLVTRILNELEDPPTTHLLGSTGALIFKYSGGWSPQGGSPVSITHRADQSGFAAELANLWD